MSTEPSQEQARRASIHEQRLKRQQGKQPNRSQVRAAQSRAVQTQRATPTVPVITADADGVAVPATSATPRSMTAAQRRALERRTTARGTGMPQGVVTLTRDQEMSMVREDMHRLLAIAGVLLVGMIILLFFID